MKRVLNLLLLAVALFGSAIGYALLIAWLEIPFPWWLNESYVVAILGIGTMLMLKPLIARLLKLKETNDEL